MATANSKLKIDFGYDSFGTSNVHGDMDITGSLSVGGNLAFSGTTVGNFIPDQDQRSLGNTVNRWNLIGYSANLASTLTVTGSASLQDTLSVTSTISGGNTTISGFANVTTSVNSALLTVGTSFIANTTGMYHTGTSNVSSITLSNSSVIGIVTANISGVYPSSNVAGSELGTSSRRWIISGNTGNFSGQMTVSGTTTLSGNATLNGTLQTISGNVDIDSGVLFVDSVNNRVGINNSAPTVAFYVVGSANVTSSVNSALFTVGSDFVANTTGVYHTGTVNALSHTVGSNFIANSTALTSDGFANLTAATSSLRVGNSSVNSFVNSSTISIGTGNFSVGANVGANVRLSNTSLLLGNSTANSTITSSVVSVSNSTSTSNISPLGLLVGASAVNSTGLFVGVGEFTSYANVGSNVNINTTAIFIGNSTVNTTITNSIVSVSNSTSTANLSPSNITIGSAVVNSTILTITTGNFSAGANVGANVNLTTAGFQIGNSSVNTQVNSSLISIGTGNFSVGANVGSNVKLTSVLLSVGNSTVNSSVNSTVIFSTGSANIGTSVNSAALTVGSDFVANSTAIVGTGYANITTSVNSALLTVGSNFIANSTAVIGTGYANITTSVNSALFTVGSSFIANTTGVYHSGLINAASISIGSSSFIANSTAVVISDPLTANGTTGTAGQALFSNGTNGSPYWATTGTSVTDDTSTNGSRYILFANQTSGALSPAYVASSKLTFNPSTGTLTTTVLTTTSDFNLKSNILTINNPIDVIMQLRGVSFNRKETGVKDYGVVAQEIEQIIPDVVHQDPDGHKSVSYSSIIGFLIEAIKDQQKQINRLTGLEDSNGD